jgi:hypothetical protein
MKQMKKFLIHLLMLVMLTPGLACGPFMTVGKAHAAAVQMKDMPNCHGMDMGKNTDGKDTSAKDGPMLFKDCSKADLFSADHVSLKKLDVTKAFFMAWADSVPAYVFTPVDFYATRGPPPDWPELSETQPSILLTTQRFRE